jgi:phytoene dehydrogenase-like protein
MTPYDSIIIGAGHNGLTTAAYLAKAGQKVLVLERRDIVGGSVVTEEFLSGYRVDSCCHTGVLNPDVVRDLGLSQLNARAANLTPSVFAPQPEGRKSLSGDSYLRLSSGMAQTIDSIARFSKADAKQWPAFVALLTKVAGFLNEVYSTTFPRVPKVDVSEAPVLAQLGLKLRGLGKKDMMEAIRLLPMSAVELLDEWFESDALKGAIGAQAIHNLTQGPMAAGTAYNLAHGWAINNGLFKSTPKGGVGALTQTLAQAAKTFGAEIRTGAEVARVNVQDGRAVGVTLTNGETLTAKRIVSNADPRRTFLTLVGPMELDPHFVWAVQNIKLRGSTAKVHLALNGLPAFTANPDPAVLRGTTVIAPSLNYLERAYDAAKYGDYSQKPYLEITVPTLADPSLAPEGKHVMSIHVQYAPYHLKTGTWDDKRSTLGDLVIETLSDYAPTLKSLISNLQVLTPLDLENIYGLTEGNLNHGEIMLDQILFMRPIPGYAQYRTPIDNLYLCGSGTHPGGGVSGACGRNAAKQVLKDLKG